MPRITESQFAAFGEELEKLSSTWYGNVARAVGRFGQRQLHSLSGWTPKGFHNVHAIEAMGAGAAPARKILAGTARGPARDRALATLAANEKAQEMGMTSLPGVLRSLVKNPKETARAGWNQQMKGTTHLEKALTVGLPGAMLVSDAMSPDDGSKGERIGAGVANTAVGMLTGGMPLAGGMVAGMAAGHVGGKIGRHFDKKKSLHRSTVQAPPNPEDSKGNGMPVEHVMSPSAHGRSEVFG